MRLISSLCVGTLLLAELTGAQDSRVAFDNGWRLLGEGTRVVQFDGRSALEMVNGQGILSDLRFQDGTIDVDVRFPTQRSFIYLKFRMQSDSEYEEIYLRPHKSNLPDATQYAPVFQSSSAWQFYHGPGGATAADLPGDQWLTVRLVLAGRQAALFVGDTLTPVLVVPRLAREPAPGSIGLRSFVPGQPPQGTIGARFANLVVRPNDIRFRFPSPNAASIAPRAGTVLAWEVGRAFVPDTGSRLPVSAESIRGGFQSVPVEPDKGFVLLHRHVVVPAGARRVATVARLRVRATAAGVRRFNLGFSDEVSVYLNGKILFSGDARYSFDEPRREGLIGLDQASLYLPLNAGDNELTIVVADGFGGWGLMGQFEDPSGLTLASGRLR